MFTDMVGYTALGQKNESLSLVLVKEQRKLIRPILRRHNGREVKTMGDAFLVEFPNALDAVRCAYDIQRATREFNISTSEERRIHLRVGIHLGDVVESRGDISGDAVNLASRIEPLAEDGGVCLTRQVYDQVQNKFELPVVSVGFKPLKNVSTPVEVCKMVMPWSEMRETSSIQLNKRRIVVLPFASLSPDPADEYFADGMTEELISSMAGISGLRVIARTSAMHFKGTAKTILEIGQELRVGSVLEGSIRKYGNKLRVTAQLIDTTTEEHLWSSKYDRELIDLFAIQSDIAEQVSKALEIRLLEGDEEKVQKIEIGDLAAYEHYLKGRQLLNRETGKGIQDAQKEFEKAIMMDPNFARAYSGLADTLMLLGHGFLPLDTARWRAEEAASKALVLDESLAEAHTSIGRIAQENLDWKRAESEYKRAISLNPSYSTAHRWYANCLADMGRIAQALAEAQRAEEADPLSPVAIMGVGAMKYYMGKDDEAWTHWEKAVRLDPWFPGANDWRAELLLLRGKAQEAIMVMEEAMAIDPTALWWKTILAQVYGIAGMKAEALKILDELKKLPKDKFVRPGTLAWIYAGLGDLDEFYKLAEMSIDERQMLNMAYLRYSRFTKDARSDPRYPILLKKANLS